MTTQQKLDCLLTHLNVLTPQQGDGVSLRAQDITLLCEKCGFKNNAEIAFYIRSLQDEQLVKSHCAKDNTILAATITINGYRRLDEL